jgi:hypothetical protein
LPHPLARPALRCCISRSLGRSWRESSQPAGDWRRLTCRIVGDRGAATALSLVERHVDDRIRAVTRDGERMCLVESVVE